MRVFKNKKGVTLIELIIGLALISIVITLTTTMIIFAVKSQDIVSDEFQIQSDMRLASQVINDEIRYASAVFILNDEQFSNASVKEGWSYFALSDDEKEIFHYKWHESTLSHIKTSVVKAASEITYNLNFEKDSQDAFMIKFVLDGFLTNGQLKGNITSHLNALNTVVVDDAGTLMSPGIALAYRTQDIPDPEKVKVAVTLILDKSGSMGYTMGGGDSSIRIQNMKVEAKKLIDTFAEMGNVYVALVPFAKTANDPNEFLKASDHQTSLKNSIDSLSASGGTNAGDGLRQSYYRHKNYNDNLASDESVLNYAILLMDGNPTYYPKKDGSNYYGDGNNSGVGGDGSSTITDSLAYIQSFSNMKVKVVDSSQSAFLKTFVIGFTGVVEEVNRAKLISDYSTHASDERVKGFYYSATSSEALANAFKAISDFILQETWHIFGPTQ